MESWILLLQSKGTLTLQETRSIHDSMDRPKFEFITYAQVTHSRITSRFYYGLNLTDDPRKTNFRIIDTDALYAYD